MSMACIAGKMLGSFTGFDVKGCSKSCGESDRVAKMR
jgi:hypothetical protein